LFYQLDFSAEVIAWYRENKRNLPWRNTKIPYFIWISEIILQQTRVEQGLAYYERFVERFPTIENLAAANEDEVLKLWQGLGYYSRARNLHFTAKTICKNLNGKFPNNYAEIRKLKGIGDYTAAAIASFCFNQPHPVVDGNVYRVLSRVFGITTPIDTAKGKKEFYALAHELLDSQKPAWHNQAMMEFGAIHCTPKNPACASCIFKSKCIAFNKKIVKKLPVKAGKTKQRNRYFDYLIIKQNGNIFIKKRTEKDIWKNLYEFPLIENKKQMSENNLIKSKKWNELLGKSRYHIVKKSSIYKHVLSHQKLFTRFWEIEVSKPHKKLPDSFIPIREQALGKYPVSQLIANYLEKNLCKQNI